MAERNAGAAVIRVDSQQISPKTEEPAPRDASMSEVREVQQPRAPPRTGRSESEKAFVAELEAVHPKVGPWSAGIPADVTTSIRKAADTLRESRGEVSPTRACFQILNPYLV